MAKGLINAAAVALLVRYSAAVEKGSWLARVAQGSAPSSNAWHTTARVGGAMVLVGGDAGGANSSFAFDSVQSKWI